MSVVVTVTGMDIEACKAGKGGERIRQHLARTGTESGIEFEAQGEPTLAFERLEEVGVLWAKRGSK
jgi:hypothetical protein